MSLTKTFVALALSFAVLVLGKPAQAQLACFDLFRADTQAASFPSDAHIRDEIKKHQAEVKSIEDPTDGLLTKLALIRRAKTSIDLTYYIFKRDQSGYLILNELKEAIKRGVNVRVLVDSVGSFHTTHSELLALLEVAQTEAGVVGKVEVATINPPSPASRFLSRLGNFIFGTYPGETLFRVNNRSHDKILMIDSGTPNMMAVVGGRNIGDDYYGLNLGDKIPIRDYEVLIKPSSVEGGGSIADTLAKYYDTLFFHETNRRLTNQLYGILDLDHSEEVSKMEDAHNQLVSDPALARRLREMETNGYLDKDFDSASVRFVHELQNLSANRKFFSGRWKRWQKKANPDSLSRSVLESILSAKRSVKIVSPYPLLFKRDIRLIERWLLRNPEATISFYSNSTATNDVFLAQAIFDQFVAPKLLALNKNPRIAGRVQVFSYHGGGVAPKGKIGQLFERFLGRPPSEEPSRPASNLMHAKLVVIDDAEVLVSTSNLDGRSRLHNSEMGVWIESATVVDKMSGYFTELQAQSHAWGSREWQANRRGLLTAWGSTLQKYLQLLADQYEITPLL